MAIYLSRKKSNKENADIIHQKLGFNSPYSEDYDLALYAPPSVIERIAFGLEATSPGKGPWISVKIEPAPTDGSAFFAYGKHPDPVSPLASRGVKPGDHWWAIVLWGGAWSEGLGWVFALNGAPAFGEPLFWQKPTIPSVEE